MSVTYGFEIECGGLNEEEMTAALSGVDGSRYGGWWRYHESRVLGQRGFRPSDGNHPDGPLWVVEEDSSLFGLGRTSPTYSAGGGHLRGSIGHEVISPILPGMSGLQHMKRIVRSLSQHGATVNSSCGLHLTIGVENSFSRFRRMSAGKKAQTLMRAVEAYDYFGAGIDMLVSQSRRCGSPTSRGGCYGERNFMVDGNMYGTRTKEQATHALRRIGRGYVNVESFWENGTIEFRQHNGTLNGYKIETWALLMHRILSWAINDNHPNHSSSMLSVEPSLSGLLDLLAVGSELRDRVMMRATQIGALGNNWVDVERRDWHRQARCTAALAAAAGRHLAETTHSEQLQRNLHPHPEGPQPTRDSFELLSGLFVEAL